MKLIERRIQEIGKSLLVTLPKGWAKTIKLKKGSLVKMTISDQGILTISPEMNATAEHKEVTLPLDKYFIRRFYREYFHGNEKITFTMDKDATEQDRKSLSLLLSRFMNVQVIEETASKIVVKCFKIEELSIEECLKRMYFLGNNIFEGFLDSNDKAKLKEMDDSVTRFYYMLVMQIRRYLTEGKFTEQNQITLTRAMDFRMVAEKVERIADLVKNQPSPKDKATVALWKDVHGHYRQSFLSFLGKEYEKALNLMLEHQNLIKKYHILLDKAAQRRDIKAYAQLRDMITIIWYSRDISMLVR